jgi:hypothetical protein
LGLPHMTIFLGNQCYSPVGRRPYVRLDGAPSAFYVWQSCCATCGELFEVTNRSNNFPRAKANRRCIEHRQPGVRADRHDGVVSASVARRRSAARLLAKQKSERAARWEATAKEVRAVWKEREAAAKLARIAADQKRRAERARRKAERLANQRIKAPRLINSTAQRMEKYAEIMRQRSGKTTNTKAKKLKIINLG